MASESYAYQPANASLISPWGQAESDKQFSTLPAKPRRNITYRSIIYLITAIIFLLVMYHIYNRYSEPTFDYASSSPFLSETYEYPRRNCPTDNTLPVYMQPFSKECRENRRANAVIVALVRNSELDEMKDTLRSFEDRFNRNYEYPYVFLNDEEFTEEFKAHVMKKNA